MYELKGLVRIVLNGEVLQLFLGNWNELAPTDVQFVKLLFEGIFSHIGRGNTQ